MIQVYATKRGEKYRLLVVGHAGKSMEGSLVCAAVSTLTEALVLFAKQNSACRYVRAGLERGYAFLSCCFGLEDPYRMTVAALHRLADDYPAHVRVFCADEALDDRSEST